MANIYQVSRRFNVGELITFYQLDLTRQGGIVYNFTNNVFEERLPIKHGGITYVYMPVAMEEVAVDAQSAPAQPRFSIATSGGPLTALLQQYNGLRGARVRRFRTYAEFLDEKPDGAGGIIPNPDADAAAIIGEELYVIDRLLGSDNTFAELQLVAPTDQEGVELPLRIVRKRWCDAQYPNYIAETDDFVYYDQIDGGCPWRHTSGQYFDANDQPTTREKDRCSKLVTGCTLRFGKAVALPATMCPGIRAQNEA